jgi:hypothetical protein
MHAIRGLLFAVLALVVLALPVNAQAPAQSKLLSMPSVIALGAQHLPARSCALRQTLWIEHYTTVLYLPGHATVTEELTNAKVPKALRLQIINRRFIPDDIPAKWREPMRKTLEAKTMERAREAFRDLKSGDSVVMSYQPQSGVSVSVNDQVVAGARGHALIESLLETWTDDSPLREKLQRTISRNPCPPGMVAGL